MTNTQIIERLRKILDGINFDTFTYENIEDLITDLLDK